MIGKYPEGNQITPSTNLEWHPCHTDLDATFLCARLTVPMDYDRPLNSSPNVPKVHIALLLLPAAQNQNQTDPSSSKPKSPLLVNPGGPGGSGTGLVLRAGAALQAVLGPDQPILGFDPRGVPFTTPTADCWVKPPPDSCLNKTSSTDSSGGSSDSDRCAQPTLPGLLRRLEWENTNAALGLMHADDLSTVARVRASQTAVNAMCRERDEHLAGDSGLAWTGTEHVARDMVSIVDAWDEWVEKEGGEERELKGKLVYWGFSYGTYLGATFARMFPERVGRVIVDGVVDAELYEEMLWRESLLDADSVLIPFWGYCASAKKRCALYREGDKMIDVKKRYDKVMEMLEKDFITFTHPQHYYPVLLQASLFKMLVFRGLYTPMQSFPSVAVLLNMVLEKNFQGLSLIFPDPKAMCAVETSPEIMDWLTDAQRAIMCGDKTVREDWAPEVWADSLTAMRNTSRFADIWASIMIQCNNWQVPSTSGSDKLTPVPNHPSRKPWPVGPPETPWAPKPSDRIKTAHPLLFLSNSNDPVTPLHAAVKMALKFEGAGIVEQRGFGHCTISMVSTCTANIVRDYLNSDRTPPPPQNVSHKFGRLRGEWAQCPVNERPWLGPMYGIHDVWTAERKVMADGLRNLQREFALLDMDGLGRRMDFGPESSGRRPTVS
ncbi:TAP-like protein-domain-containing protein [Dichotomopilus funicola]|uniref:TAP-like protein-domain-containing protein n=1 Tax=Dichotomopilus funicola TaxID=1934379 RepID=A0AAN6V0U0_9PEZI|nr:TAP-like protein-domain-containing protein [Dichotomopilus funicola]